MGYHSPRIERRYITCVLDTPNYVSCRRSSSRFLLGQWIDRYSNLTPPGSTLILYLLRPCSRAAVRERTIAPSLRGPPISRCVGFLSAPRVIAICSHSTSPLATSPKIRQAPWAEIDLQRSPERGGDIGFHGLLLSLLLATPQ